jgi:Fe-Mn family superoxide dismutase
MKPDKARKENADLTIKALLKELSFHTGVTVSIPSSGRILHLQEREEVACRKMNLQRQPMPNTAHSNRLKKEFIQVASSTEGSGWAVLPSCMMTNRLLIMQFEKHNVNVIPGFRIHMALDVLEHTYYLDYKNDRAKFKRSFWTIVNWVEIHKRLITDLKK